MRDTADPLVALTAELHELRQLVIEAWASAEHKLTDIQTITKRIETSRFEPRSPSLPQTPTPPQDDLVVLNLARPGHSEDGSVAGCAAALRDAARAVKVEEARRPGTPTILEEQTVTLGSLGSKVSEERALEIIEIPLSANDGELGFEVAVHAGITKVAPTVSNVNPRSRAFQLGVRSGYHICSCNGVPLSGKDQADVTMCLRARPLLLCLGQGDGCHTVQRESGTNSLSVDSAASHKHSVLQNIQQNFSKMSTISRFSQDDENIVDILCAASSYAKWALLFGGFGVFRRRWLQKLYLFVFVSSFLACFSACLANLFVQSPPYINMPAELLTVYFHVVGVHTLIRWRLFIKDPSLVALIRRLRDPDAGMSIDSQVWQLLRSRVRLASRILLALQLVGVLWGYMVFSRPAFDYWASGEGAAGDASPGAEAMERSFSLMHAIQMIISIPSHVPTLIASYGLFMFVNRLHALDAKHITRLLGRPKHLRQARLASRDHVSLADMCADMANEAQDRLDKTCGRFELLLVHQLTYIFLQFLFVALNFKSHYDAVLRSGFSFARELLYEGWHLYIGLIGLVSILLAPASLTGVFCGVQERVFKGLRARGAHHHFAVQSAKDVGYHVIGFTVFGVRISSQFAILFLSVILSILSFHLDLGDR